MFLQTAYMQPIAVDLATYARNGTIVDVGEPLLAASGVITPAAGENGNIVFDYSVVNICRVARHRHGHHRREPGSGRPAVPDRDGPHASNVRSW